MSLFRRKSKLSEDTMVNGVKMITALHPKAIVSEQFRTIRTNIEFASVDTSIRTIMFTSADSSEGKSTVSANVSVTWAQQGRRVLFVDADLRRPTLHSTFGLQNTQGLTTLLTQNSVDEYEQFIHKSTIDNLFVLSSGPVPPNPAELLNSRRMDSFIEKVKKDYDMVVFDVPPMLTVTDAQLLTAKVDGVVLVVRFGVTQKAALSRTKELLDLAHANVLGYVMNDAAGDAEGSGYGYGYGYGYGKTDEKEEK